MFRILKKEILAPRIKLFEIEAPAIARKALPGHFVVVRLHERGERIPLTISDHSAERGTIEIVIQEVGKTTYEMGLLEEGDYIQDVVGPLGTPFEVKKVGCVVCVSGGLGVTPMYPKARAYHELGTKVISIQGAQTKELLIFTDRMEKVSDRVYYSTDDGSFGYHGFVTGPLSEVLASGEQVDEVVAIGPLPMMRACCKVTKEFGVKTYVSLNAIMVDGTGMCGSCRVTVGGEVKFSCVDGPAFDGHLVNFEELMARQNRFIEEEREALRRFREEGCKCHHR